MERNTTNKFNRHNVPWPDSYQRDNVRGGGGGHILGGEGTPYNGLYGEAPPKRGTFFRLQVYERVGISLVEVYKRVGKFVIRICKRAQKG